jgi:hypothetical protein
LSSTAASAILKQPCPPGAVAKGWRRDGEFPSSAAWCEDAHGVLQGATISKLTDCGGITTRIGHYRDGVPDGVFTGPDISATYAMGLLEGPCRTPIYTLTYHQGRLDGPFAQQFGVHQDSGPELEADWRGCHGFHHPVFAAEGIVRGVLVNGVAVSKLVIGHGGEEREVSIVPGVSSTIPELGRHAQDFAGLLGPAHRWGRWPSCEYHNDRSAHHGPLP